MDIWPLVFFLVGVWFGLAYRWLEVNNLKIQLFFQCNELYILEEQVKNLGLLVKSRRGRM